MEAGLPEESQNWPAFDAKRAIVAYSQCLQANKRDL
jgi:hypothetical protein